MMQSNPQIDNLPPEIEMPKYKCHKIVHALAIGSIIYNTNGSVDLFFQDHRFASVNLEGKEADRFKDLDINPDCGYLVVYDDGYRSWSPTKVFEDGYNLTDGLGELLARRVIARVCHEVNRAYCESLGDTSQPTWDDAPDWQQDSAIAGVDLHMDNPHASSADSHNSWMKQKIDEGWTYGVTKCDNLKMHPCMVPFLELPREQQAKDYIFRAIVHALR